MHIKAYQQLIAWQKAIALVTCIYSVTSKFPRDEIYGLTSQLRRAAVSVPSNITEGHGRLTDSQFRHFLGNARGSLYEMQTQVELAMDLGYLDDKRASELLDQASEGGRLINGLITSMGRSTKAMGTITDADDPG